ncbi:MAG: hypothetical protein JNL01_05120 [Bdellovibrionales bacterium]|nr:hypothetical protein [Bdellovibrionales bacterium]
MGKLSRILAAAFLAWTFSGCGKGLDTTFVIKAPELEVKTGLKAWYRAASFSGTFNFGASLSGATWSGQDGYGSSLITSGSNLYFQGSPPNGSYPGTQSVSVAGSATKFFVAASNLGTFSRISIYAALRLPSAGDGGVGVSSGAGFTCGSIDQIGLFAESGTGYWRADICKSGYGSAVTAALDNTGQNTASRILRVRFNESDQTIRLFAPGMTESVSSTSSIGTNTLTLTGEFSIGALSGVANNGTADVYEVLVYDSILSSDDDSSVIEYLRNSHPVH